MSKPGHLHCLRIYFGRKSCPRPRPAPLINSMPKITSFSVAGVCRFSSSSTASSFSHSSDDITDLCARTLLVSDKSSFLSQDGEVDNIHPQISLLADELLSFNHLSNREDEDDLTGLGAFLDSHPAVSLLRKLPSGFAFVELLSLLKGRPRLALQVFLWRLKLADAGVQLVPQEYSLAISLAGRSNKAGLARNLFTDALRRGIRSTGMYNSLMAAYMCNGLAFNAISIFDDLRHDPECNASIVTYNILLSVYGRLMLIDKVENVLKQIHELPHLSPDLSTYNILLKAYLIAWMWDRMEKTYEGMLDGDVKPDALTHCLMLRGYAYACNMEKMERMYELVKELVNKSVPSLVQVMISAYCKSTTKNRIKKVEELMEHISEDELKSWLYVFMINEYAQEGLLDSMERLICKAIHRNIRITAKGVMHSIISSYFRHDSLDRLTEFIGLAECAGWKLNHSLYRYKMEMYGQRNQFEEMHKILDKMKRKGFVCTRKTFLIMYRAYLKAGRRHEAKILIGMMCKYGFLESRDDLLSGGLGGC